MLPRKLRLHRFLSSRGVLLKMPNELLRNIFWFASKGACKSILMVSLIIADWGSWVVVWSCHNCVRRYGCYYLLQHEKWPLKPNSWLCHTLLQQLLSTHFTITSNETFKSLWRNYPLFAKLFQFSCSGGFLNSTLFKTSESYFNPDCDEATPVLHFVFRSIIWVFLTTANCLTK